MELRELVDYKGYFVNTLGQVFKGSDPIRLRKQQSGYILVSLRNNNGHYKQELAHRLVGYAFLGLTKNMVIDHINGIKDDNRLENLEVVTIKENNIRRYKLQGPPLRLSEYIKLKNNRAVSNFLNKFVSFK